MPIAPFISPVAFSRRLIAPSNKPNARDRVILIWMIATDARWIESAALRTVARTREGQRVLTKEVGRPWQLFNCFVRSVPIGRVPRFHVSREGETQIDIQSSASSALLHENTVYFASSCVMFWGSRVMLLSRQVCYKKQRCDTTNNLLQSYCNMLRTSTTQHSSEAFLPSSRGTMSAVLISNGRIRVCGWYVANSFRNACTSEK